MSNVKKVSIKGYMPFDANNNNPNMLRILGQLNLPSLGIRINYNSNNMKMIPNPETNGKYMYYGFEISGQEAVSNEYLYSLISIFRENKCFIISAEAKDIEAQENIILMYEETYSQEERDLRDEYQINEEKDCKFAFISDFYDHFLRDY